MWALHSHLVAIGKIYRQDPVLHGPLLCHLNGLFLRLVGGNDFTVRATAAAAGVGLVLMMLPFRRFLGRTGALAAALLLTISPSLLFYSRYLRNDVYVAFFGLVWVYSAFRYLEERRRVWLLPFTIVMALSFATKETSFILAAIVGSFFVGTSVLGALRRCDPLRDSPSSDLAGLTLVLLLPFAASLAHLTLGWDPTDSESAEGLRRSAVAVAATFAFSVTLAIIWFRRRPRVRGQAGCSLLDVAGLMLAFWFLQITLFSSLFRNLGPGSASGIVGSLGHWLLQHEVARGGQPWFYYLMLGGLYEFLSLMLCSAGAVALIRHQWRRMRPASTEIVRAAETETIAFRAFLFFCLWWWVASWVAYSIAGEKMPWLLIHLSLPACLLAGWWVGRLIDGVDWRAIGPYRSLLLVTAPSGYLLFANRLVALSPFKSDGIDAAGTSGRWLFWLVATLAVILMTHLVVRSVGFRHARRPLEIGLMVLFALLTGRFAIMASYIHYDLAVEPLVYAHGTPDLRTVLEEISLLERESGLREDLLVAVDDQTTWPFAWYFRERPSTVFFGDAPIPALTQAHVVIVGADSATRTWPYLERNFLKRDYFLLWWPMEGYRTASLLQLAKTLSDPVARRDLWQILWRRNYGVDLRQWPLVKKFEVWARRELVA
jgi:uncharacterized protein (TIGR03663 family)